MLKTSVLLISVILCTACRAATPVPLSNPAATASPVSTIVTTTPQPMPFFMSTSSATDKVRLYYNQVAAGTMGDEYSFTVVLDPDAGFTPRIIEIWERETQFRVGQYKLLNKAEIESRCAQVMQNPDLRFYETVLVNYLNFPPDFLIRAYYEDDFVFGIYALRAGDPEYIEKGALDGGCETYVP